jgi:hypothetical protein
MPVEFTAAITQSRVLNLRQRQRQGPIAAANAFLAQTLAPETSCRDIVRKAALMP